MDASAIVECRSDASYAERPMAFIWEGQRLEVAAVVSRWHAPTGTGFRVRTTQEQVFDLFYDENLDLWSIYPHDHIEGIQQDEQDSRDVQD